MHSTAHFMATAGACALGAAHDKLRRGVRTGLALAFLAGALQAEADAPFIVSLVPSDAPELAVPTARDQALTTAQIEAMVRRAVDLVGGMASVVPDTARLVVLKPNVGMDKESGSGVITDNRVVRAVALLVHEAAPGARILVAEGAGGWADPDSVAKYELDVYPDAQKDGFTTAGYRDMVADLREQGLDIDCHDLNFDTAPVLRVPGGGLARDEYEVAATINRADVWINCPVAKTHGAKITCCMKNHFGILPGRVYGWSKSNGTEGHAGIPHAPRIVDEAFVDLWMLSQVDLNVVDMVQGAEAGSFAGTPKRGNMVLAGRDPVATDLVVGKLMGYNPDDLEFAELAAQRGWGPGRFERVTAVGAQVESLVTRYKKAGVDYEGAWREQAMYGMGPRRWALLGPLSPEDVPSPEAAAGFQPTPGENGWSPVVWFGHDKIDLDRYYDDPTHCSAFAFTYFRMARSDSVRFWIGSDEGLQVWLDGESIYSFEGRRRHVLGMEQVPGYVEAGEHRLLIRANQTRGRFDFSFNVCEPIDDEFYAGNRYPGVRYYLDEAMPQRQEVSQVRAEDARDDWGEPYFESSLTGIEPVELARTAPDSVALPGPDSLEVADLLGVAAAVVGLEEPYLDSTALACLSALPFDLGYAGLHGWWPRYGPPAGRLMAWLGLSYDIRAGYGLREALKTAKGWLVSGRTPIVAMGDNSWAVVTGHRVREGTVQLQMVAADTSGWFDREHPRWSQLPGGRWQQCAVVAVERAGPAIAAAALADSLAALAVELALVPWTEEPSASGIARRFPAGLAGWDAWVIAWERAPLTAEWARQLTLGWYFNELQAWSLPALRDGRRRAAGYFSGAAESARGERAELLQEAGAAYAEVADLFEQLLSLLPKQMGEAMTSEDEPKLEELRLNKPLVRQARAAERRALAALNRLTGGPDLPAAREDPLRLKEQGRRLCTWQAELSQGVGDLRLRGDQLEYERLGGREVEGVSFEVLSPVPGEPGWQVAVEALRGVGRYDVVQQPGADNGWETIVRVDDGWTGDSPTELVLWAVPVNPE